MTPSDPHADPRGEPLFVSLREAAQIAGVSLSTAKRRRPELIAAGASQDASGRWHVPRMAVDVLREPPGDPIVTPGGQTPRDPLPEPRRVEPDAEVEQWRARAIDAEQRAAVAEARAEERQRALDAAQDQVRAYLQIEAVRQLGPGRQRADDGADEGVHFADTAGQAPKEQGPGTLFPEPKKRWWHRFRN